MNEMQEGRQDAIAALAEANRRESQVRRTADSQLAWILGVLAASVLVIAGLMSAAFHVVGPAVLAVYLIAIVLVAVVFFRIRVYSRGGLKIFSFSASTFTIWNALSAAVSVATGWWGPSAPSFHLVITEVVAVLPLLVGIWMLARRRS